MHTTSSPTCRISLRLGLLAFGVLVLVGSAFTGGGQATPEYKPVANWPQWPEGVARHPVSAVATDSAFWPNGARQESPMACSSTSSGRSWWT